MWSTRWGDPEFFLRSGCFPHVLPYGTEPFLFKNDNVKQELEAEGMNGHTVVFTRIPPIQKEE